MFNLIRQRLAGSQSNVRRLLSKCRRMSTLSDESILRHWIGTSTSTLDCNTSSPFEPQMIDFSRSEADDGSIVTLSLKRPGKLNAMNMQLWMELGQAFHQIENDHETKVVVLKGDRQAFSTGMDLNVFATLQKLSNEESCEGRRRESLTRIIERWQNIVSAPERCKVPVIASISGPCIGGAVDLITACDLRYCDTSAAFSIKEVDLAIVADIGTLQRLPSLVGESRAKELSYTGRTITGLEAEKYGLVLDCAVDSHELDEKVHQVATHVARQSPLTIRGIKTTLNYQRDHSIPDGLAQVRQLNASILYSADLVEAFSALMEKRAPSFRY